MRSGTRSGDGGDHRAAVALLELLGAMPASEGTSHVGHHSPRTFSHDPLEGPDDRKRLLGED
jgi:hypothetical protein